MWRERVMPDYLCFTAEQANSTVKLNKTWSPTAVTLETSTDWNTWNTYTFWNTITLSNVWDKVYWRNTSETDTWFNLNAWDMYKFVMTWSIAWSGDINFLLNKNSTTTLSDSCYMRLFDWCTSLTTAPRLPATDLWTYGCYSRMFNWCTNLTIAPELPATTLIDAAYAYMFSWCTSLTTAPSLPATTLVGGSYYYMFNWCTSLETLPKLPAVQLTDYCYYFMFNWCSNIKLSSTQTWDYQTAYRIPTTWTGITASNWGSQMFRQTWWTFTWTPSINTTYYTSNTVV